MAKRLNYQVGLTADTTQLQAAVNQALSSLQRLGTSSGLQVTTQLREASAAALDLAVNLRNAYNSDTGKLDLSTFSQSLKLGNTNLQQYYNQLKMLGPEGQQAFLQVASAIGQAELPTRRLSTLTESLWTTMKNTMRWQLTSSMLHGFIGTVQTALHYTQDLNESLNNIRIVTGKNIDDMDKFAKKANEAARVLSTTTTQYTDASLIYYQQGLNDQEVEGRTNVTIKLANAAGESAETASEQLTAIWNNFYDGSKTLEYYADVMTALGASTASSTEEISAGLQKFAAVADTVGLSYEYAASALATITATTRQSADVVGTALRTLFARIQGLQQDEEQEDGTNLNKYSQALAEVGIQIKDARGELKDMDQILNEMGETWGTLTRAQQMALAQTVAGVRQYTQLIALMENWDFFQENLGTAMDSEGTLQEQADIYAESWEAARDRIKSAAEDVYDSLINDDFFIGLDNSITPVLTTIAKMIDSIGGMQGILAMVAMLMNRAFGEKIANGLLNLANNFGVLTQKEAENARNLQAQSAALASQLTIIDAGNQAQAMRFSMMQDEIQLQGQINAQSDSFSIIQRKIIDADMQRIAIVKEQVSASADRLEVLEREREILREELALTQEQNFNRDNWRNRVGEQANAALQSANSVGYGRNYAVDISSANKVTSTQAFNELDKVLQQLATDYNKLIDLGRTLSALQPVDSSDTQAVEAYNNSIIKLAKDFGILEEGADLSQINIDELRQKLGELSGRSTDVMASIRGLKTVMSSLGYDETIITRYIQAILSIKDESERAAKAQELLKQMIEEANNHMRNPAPITWAEQLVSVGSVLSSIAMGLNAIKNIGSVFTDDDMSMWDKFVSIMMTLGMIIPSVNFAWSALDKIRIVSIGTSTASAAAEVADAAAKEKDTEATQENAVAEGQEAQATTAAAGAKVVEAVATEGSKDAKIGETGVLKTNTQETNSNTASKLANLGVIGLIIGAVALLVVGIKALIDAYNADAIAAEKAAKTAEALNDAAKETKQRLDDIKSSVESYNDALEALNNCVRGTEEWNEALETLNGQIDELLTKYPELLKSADLFNSDGTLNAQVLQDAIDQATYAVGATSAAALYGNIIKEQASLKSSITNFDREVDNPFALADYGEEGSLSNGGVTVQSDIDYVLNSFKQLGKEVLTWQDVNDSLIDRFGYARTITKGYADEVYNLAKRTLEADQMMSNATEVTIASWSQNTGTELTDAQTKIMTSTQNLWINTFKAALKQINTDQIDSPDRTDNSKLGEEFGERFAGKSITEAFNIARGTNYELAANGIRGFDDNRRFVFLENGDEKEYRFEEIQSTIAAAAALDKLTDSSEIASNILSNLSTNANSEAVVKGIQDYIASGTLESLNDNEYKQLTNDIGTYDDTATYLQETLGLSDEELQTILGANYAEAFDAALGNYKNAFDDYIKNLAYATQTAIEGLNLSNVSVIGKKAIADMLEDALVYGGEDALTTATTLLQNIGEDNLQGFADIVGSFDWSTAGPTDFIAALEAANIETGLTKEELTNFVNVMSQGKEVTLEAVEAQYSALAKITDSLSDGSTITQEDIDALANAGVAVDKLFVQLADGTYALATDLSTALELIQGVAMKQLYDLSDSALDTYNQLQVLHHYGEAIQNFGTEQQITALQQTGRITDEEAGRYRADLNSPDISEETAEKVKEAFENANISAEDINEAMTGAGQEAAKIQKAITETEFRNDVERYDLDLEETINYAERLQKELSLDEKQAKNLAIANQRLNRGVSDLNDNFEDYQEVLTENNKGTSEWSKALDNLKANLADILNLGDANLISDEFAEAAFSSNELKLALDGDVEALQALQEMAADDIVQQIKIELPEDEEIRTEFQSLWDMLQAEMPAELEGPTVNQGKLAAAFQEMIDMGVWTKDQIEAALAGLHVSANVETKYIGQTISVPQTITEEKFEPIRTETIDVPNPDGTWTTQEVTARRKYTTTFQGPPVEVEGYVPQYTITGTEGEGGNVVTFTPTEPPHVSPTVTTSGKAKSSGSSSSSEPKKLNKKTPADNNDRYHEMDRNIQNELDAINEIDEAADRAYGVDRLKLYSSEMQHLNKQIELYQQKQQLTDHFLAEDQTELQKLFNDTVTFNSDGEIEHYQDLLDTMNKEYNAFVDKYNAATAEQQEAMEQEKEDVEELYDQRERALEQYEETLDTHRENIDKIQDAIRERLDKALTSLEYTLEIKIDIKNLKDSLRDYQKNLASIFSDSLIHGQRTAMLDQMSAQAQANMMDDYHRQMQQLMALYDTANTDEDRGRIADDLKELQSNMLEAANAIVEWANTIEDIVPQAVEDANNRFKEFTDSLEHNRSILDQIEELYTLQGTTYKTKEGFQRLQSVAQNTMNTSIQQAIQERSRYEESLRRLQEAQAQLDALNGDETDPMYDFWKKQRDAFLETSREAEKAYLEQAKTALEEAKDMYLREIDKAVYDMGQKLSRGEGMDLLQDRYDHYIEEEERYLDKVNEAYEVTAWYNKLQKDIDDASTQAARDRYKVLQDEINARREGNTLSQYDLDILNAKYAALQAQIALEDARNAKNQLQLVRDSQGNWNYQYTANQDDIAEAEQKVADAQNEWYNLAKEQTQDITGQIIQNWQECMDAIQELYQEGLDPEETEKRRLEIERYYNEKAVYLEQEKQNAIKDMTEAGNSSLFTSAVMMGEQISDLTGMTADEIRDIVERGGGDVAGLVSATNDEIKELLGESTGAVELFDNTYGQALSNMTQDNQNFDKVLEETLRNCETSFGNFKNVVDEVASETGADMGTLDRKLSDIADSTRNIGSAWDSVKNSVWDMVNALRELALAAGNSAQNMLGIANSGFQDASEITTYLEGKATGSIGANDLSRIMAEYIAQGGSFDDNIYAQLYEMRERKINELIQQGKGRDYWIAKGSETEGHIRNLLSEASWSEAQLLEALRQLGINIAGFDVGGYTGQFDDAKLAFLHEKELVLNPDDTQNILTAVTAIRGLTPDILKNIETLLDGGALGAMAAMSSKFNLSMPDNSSGTLEQTIHIDAVEFPNVTSSEEIKNAFATIANDAVQWARRRRD